MLIGRGDEADVRIDSVFVSRYHALILRDGKQDVLLDLGSTNGLLVNSRRIVRRALRDRDLIQIGPTRVTYLTTLPAAAATSSARSGRNDLLCASGISRASVDEEQRLGSRASVAPIRPSRPLTRLAYCCDGLGLPPAGPVSTVSPSKSAKIRVFSLCSAALSAVEVTADGCAPRIECNKQEKHSPVERWRVHKFGGSSVADAVCMERVAKILEAGSAAAPRCRAVGVSRHYRRIAEPGDGRRAQGQDLDERIDQIRSRHQVIADTLLDRRSSRAVPRDARRRTCKDIHGILQTVRLIRSASQTVRDLIAGYGEIWSTRLFSAYLRARGRRPGKVEWIDAREIVSVEWGPLGPAVRWDVSRENIARVVPRDTAATLIITGFIARDPQGLQTTLGRNGSDFSGSIFGSLLDAEEIHIWTDVDGVLSADPRLVPDAKVIDSLSYNEAMELAYFGAKVIHPQTMAPAVTKNIPIWIRNTFAPEKPGTLICEKPTSQMLVKGITSIDRVALVNLEGAGMIGVPGTAHRLFGALRDHGISVILISQGSSEHSICFAIPEAEATRAEAVVRQAFDSELRLGQIQSVEVTSACSILAVVGDGMAGSHGVAAKVFGALGQRSGQRSRDCAGRLGTQHLGRHRRQASFARAALGAFQLLSVAAHDLDRFDRSWRRRRRVARSVGGAASVTCRASSRSTCACAAS